MNIRTKIAAVVLAVGLATAGVAAERERGGHRRGGALMLGRAAAELNLTDTQKEFGKQLMSDTRRQAEPLVAKLRENRQAMKTAVQANDQSAITRLSQEQGDLSGQLSALRSKAFASFYAQLTPEQRTKAEELREKFGKRAMNRAHRGERGNKPANR